MKKTNKDIKNDNVPFYKKKWFIILIVLIVIGSFGNKNKEKKVEDTANQTTSQSSSITKTEQTNSSETSNSEKITLIAGEAGQYGKNIVMNEGTDMPEELVVYYLPSGDYEVKNIGKYPSQLSIYEGFKRDESTGYDDYTNGSQITLKVDEVGTVTVPEGWFIEIHEPSKFELTKK